MVRRATPHEPAHLEVLKLVRRVLEVAAMRGDGLGSVEALLCALKIEFDVDELGRGQQPVAQREEVVAEAL